MLNVPGALRAPLLASLLAVAACSREPPADGPPPAGASTQAAQVAWAREALGRNPDLEVLAVDPKGIFTVRLRDGGGLRTVQLDELVAGLAGEPADVTAAPAGAPPDPAPADDVAADSGPNAAQAPPPLIVTRGAGSVSITGPGISIATATAAPGEARSANVERRGSQPLVCQGGRLMHIDGRVIEFDGDGLVVEDGCDLYLTNSRIEAGGTAITVTRGKVHVVNSTIKGVHGSIEASQGAQVYLSGASIDGLQRKFDTAQINDLGGNRYR
ncbi:MAG: hypothetical protein AB7P31_10515 [Steroidobacteraceae bacterium]